MKDLAFKRAGTALLWKAVQLGGVKAIFLFRLLILARLLAPEDFGLLAIAATAIGFLMQLTDLGMIPALIQSKDISENQYNTAWTVDVTRALLVTTCVVVAAPFIAQLFAEPRATAIIQVLALRPLLDAAASIKVAGLTRQLRFRPLATLKLAEAVLNTTVSVALARSLGVWALVAGTLAGSTTSLVLSYLLAPHRPRLSFDREATRPLIQFGRWIFLTGLIAVAGSSVLRVVISRQLGATELGLYFLAAQLAFLPLEVASEVVGAVAFPLFARLQEDIRQATHAFRTMLIGMSALLFSVCTLIIALAPTLVAEVLGSRWAGTVPVIRILSLVSIIGVFGEAAVPILKGLGRPHKVTVLEITQSLLIIVFAWGLAGRYGLVGAALAWLPAIIVSQIFGAWFIYQLLWRPFATLGAPMLVIMVVSGMGAGVALGIDSMVPGFAGFVLANIMAVVVFGGLLWASDRRFALGLMNDLGRVFPRVATLVGYARADG
jgi:O-antigen/teichoic acid export membrane protein